MACLDVVDLEHLCNHITEVKSSFLSINIQHIYRDHNMSADVLSKESLSLKMGKLAYIDMLDGDSIGSDSTSCSFKLCYSTYLLWHTHLS